MANFTKTQVATLTDDGLSVGFQVANDGGGGLVVEVRVLVPGEQIKADDWKDVFSAADRTKLGPLLKKAVKARLLALGYTEV